MLTPAELELLTLALDGECTQAEDARVRELLASSTEAVRVFQQLQRQRNQLAAMPVAKAPETIFQEVMARLPVEVARPKLQRRQQTSWVAYAAAACLFLWIGASAFYFTLTSNTNDQFASNALPKTAPTSNKPSNQSVALAQSLPQPPEVAPLPRGVTLSETMMAAAKSNAVEAAPAPRSANPDFVASAPGLTVTNLAEMQVRLPWLVETPDLYKPEGRTRLAAELTKAPAFRLDLHVKDSLRGVESLQNAAKTLNIKVHQDALAQDRLNRKQLGQYAFYTEALTAEDWQKLLVQLATPAAGSGQEQAILAFHLIAATQSDAGDVRTLLGAENGFLKRAGNTPSKPVSAGTLDQITNNLKGQSVEDKHAILLSYGPSSLRALPSQSTAIKTYLHHRGERKANTLPMLVVIR